MHGKKQHLRWKEKIKKHSVHDDTIHPMVSRRRKYIDNCAAAETEREYAGKGEGTGEWRKKGGGGAKPKGLSVAQDADGIATGTNCVALRRSAAVGRSGRCGTDGGGCESDDDDGGNALEDAGTAATAGATAVDGIVTPVE
jgi:hypothetical protein